jgi:putative transposase
MNNIADERLDVEEIREIDQEFFLDGLQEYLRGFVRKAFEEAIQAELTEFLGYHPYQRVARDKENNRNGYYRRDLVTRFGAIEGIEVARDRRGEFKTRVLDRYKRREKKLSEVIADMFIQGISTRKMKRITKRLFGKEYSAGTVSQINKELTEKMREWLSSPIEDDVVYLFIDGLNLPVRRYVVSKESLLMVIGITKDGRRKILGVQLGDKESSSCWREFFKDLKARGLKGKVLRMGIMDGLPGLMDAFSEAFPKAKIQRCIVHKLRNVAVKLPRSIRKDCLDHCKRIFNASSLEEAKRNFMAWKEKWYWIAPTAVECVEKDLEFLLNFYHYPKGQWKSIRSTNMIERTFKEFRRRTRQMDSFPNEDCCLRVVYAISEQLNEVWQKRRANGFPETPDSSRAERDKVEREMVLYAEQVA